MSNEQTMTVEEIAWFNRLISSAHKISVEHGWWEDPPDLHRVRNLILSEVGEFYDAYRKGGGSEKIPFSHSCEELADIVIRIMDWFGKVGIVFNHEDVTPNDVPPFDILVYSIYEDMVAFSPSRYQMVGTWVLCSCVQLARLLGEDLEDAVVAKMEFNRSRPYKHGHLKF